MTELSTVSRRRLLKAGAAAAAVGVASPWIMRSAMASSGVLNFMGWAGYDDLPKVFAAFEKKTGIKVNFTGFGNQDEMLAAAKAGGAANGSFDIVEPTADRVSNWVENDYLQPWDDKKANLDGVVRASRQHALARRHPHRGRTGRRRGRPVLGDDPRRTGAAAAPGRRPAPRRWRRLFRPADPPLALSASGCDKRMSHARAASSRRSRTVTLRLWTSSACH